RKHAAKGVRHDIFPSGATREADLDPRARTHRRRDIAKPEPFTSSSHSRRLFRQRSGIAGGDGVVATVERSSAATLFLAAGLADERSGCVECRCPEIAFVQRVSPAEWRYRLAPFELGID